jgi:ferredoxin
MPGQVSFFYPERPGRENIELRVATDRNLNLLAHAQCEEATLGSRCGGHGKCAGDRVRVLAANAAELSPPTEAERRLLSPSELVGGVRLACQCFPESDDVDIEVRVLSMDALMPGESG